MPFCQSTTAINNGGLTNPSTHGKSRTTWNGWQGHISIKTKAAVYITLRCNSINSNAMHIAWCNSTGNSRLCIEPATQWLRWQLTHMSPHHQSMQIAHIWTHARTVASRPNSPRIYAYILHALCTHVNKPCHVMQQHVQDVIKGLIQQTKCVMWEVNTQHTTHICEHSAFSCQVLHRAQ